MEEEARLPHQGLSCRGDGHRQGAVVGAVELQPCRRGLRPRLPNSPQSAHHEDVTQLHRRWCDPSSGLDNWHRPVQDRHVTRRVQDAVRAAVSPGESLATPTDRGRFSVAQYTPQRLVLLLGKTETPVRLPGMRWKECLLTCEAAAGC
jgi:hypothetical protein